MKYRVKGADRQTGKDIDATVEADNADGACAKASELGILVATCSEEAHEGSTTMECPSCAETISSKAIRCRFCGASLSQASEKPMKGIAMETNRTLNPPPVPHAQHSDGPSVIHKPLTLDLMLLIAGWILVAGGIIWFGVKLGQGYGSRFHDDNAAGAMANASEALWMNLVFGVHFLGGVGLFGLRYMRRLTLRP